MNGRLLIIQRNAWLHVFLCLFSGMAVSQVRLPRLVSDSMVLQRDCRTKIWGWASPGEKVTVHFNGQSSAAVTGVDGKWAVDLSPMPAGGPYDMDIDASDHQKVKAILIGDVWVCSGQSNMELPMERVKEKYAGLIARAGNPAIRQFAVPTRYDFNSPQEDLKAGSWQSATPASVLSFSAVGYFFARQLYEKYHVPIGLIKAAVGGSPAEAWLSEKTLQQFPQYAAVAAKYKVTAYRDSIRHREDSMSRTWYLRIAQQDPGLHNSPPWFDRGYDASAWKEMDIPGYWADQGLPPVNGVVWFRKDIDVPEQLTGTPVKLMLGRIVDQDSVYVNGIFIGTTGYQYPPRRYEIPAGILKPGKNSLVVRVINSGGRGGFVPDKPYWLGFDDRRIDLRGKWRYKPGITAEALPPTTFFQYQPLGLFNGVIAPLLPFAIKGVIWYQGEANAGKAWEYRRLFTAMIADWRQHWGEGDFPFLFVQLANFMEKRPQPSESSWATLREAQLLALSTPHTGMTVTTDIGEWNDIHPLDKEDVGKRLALAARAIAYGEKDLVYAGPLYRAMRHEGNAIRLKFTSTGSGLVAKGGGPLKGFSIAGQDKHFVWADAVIDGADVVVRNRLVPMPVAIRYGWADNPGDANLYNKEGLPASPFRTDTLPEPMHITAEQDR